jgi:hypothetical protein
MRQNKSYEIYTVMPGRLPPRHFFAFARDCKYFLMNSFTRENRIGLFQANQCGD